MTTEDKAKELSIKFARQYHHNTSSDLPNDGDFVFSDEECYNCAMEMAAWVEQRMVEKTVERIEKFVDNYKRSIEEDNE